MRNGTDQAVLSELIANTGFLPVSVDPVKRTIAWLDFGRYHFYEGFFHRSADVFSALKKGDIKTLLTGIDTLEEDALVAESIYPTGFIFHAGRSGSTMLSKVLARSRENHVISEAGPTNSIWPLFAENGHLPIQETENNKKMYRNLLLVMSRQRSKTHKHYFIKFTSFNILFFDFIHAVFPDVPAIFLNRDSEDILKSFGKKLPGWLATGDTGFLNITAQSAHTDKKEIVESFLTTAKKYPVDVLKSIDYKDLNPDLLPSILHYFKADASAKQLLLMQTQFLFDSKVEFNRKSFDENDT
ncbi:sulfotransferase family protein [Mucilaginibacter ginsenosidivorans]|uniref:Sulfotransferase family protein n=1 Tax=Mucilaginibacter ginsenosidivorans TaxID=398053 RepID=A0A5B8USN8_9SPHI|nr:hypothetical protein [Mucilaginibacter ginsenosidivorans]QEC62014.1 hypothetical protein FRZ54_05225 [Mucilaginibacter ginsenosidivorans]